MQQCDSQLIIGPSCKNS